MIILHVSDLHFTERWFAWLLESAPQHDLLCVSGDLLDQTRATPFRRQTSLVAEWLQMLERPMCICSGNHDLSFDSRLDAWSSAEWLRELASPSVSVDGETAEHRGYSILPVGYTTFPKGGPADVWVVHLPPAGLPVALSTCGLDMGDPTLIASVATHRPQLVLSGHIHDPESWFTQDDGVVYLNPGCARSSRIPNHILINLERATCSRVAESPIGAFTETMRWDPATFDAEESLLSA